MNKAMRMLTKPALFDTSILSPAINFIFYMNTTTSMVGKITGNFPIVSP